METRESRGWMWTGGIAMLLSMACVPNRPWRVSPEAPNPQGALPTSCIGGGVHGEETLVVEFDDQGETFGEGERAYALKRIDAWTADPTGKPLTLLVFIHGWHHDSRLEDKNLRGFTETLARLAESNKERRLVGVYLGWRGECTRVWGINYLSYWNRRNAAARVGGITASHFLADIAVLLQRSDKNMFIVIGHSFGGRVLETAITNSVAALCASDPDLSGPESNQGSEKPLPIPDLVVLLNEASEALRTKAAIDVFKDALAPPEKCFIPRIISITSKADLATRFALPLGQWFPALKLKFQDYQATGTPAEKRLGLTQSQLFRHSAGHLPQLWSHEVLPATPERLRRPCATPFNSRDEAGGVSDQVILPLAGVYDEGTPYWVFQVDKGVMDDHNDIFNAHIRGLLTGIVNRWFTDIPASKATPAKLRLIQKSLRRPAPQK